MSQEGKEEDSVIKPVHLAVLSLMVSFKQKQDATYVAFTCLFNLNTAKTAMAALTLSRTIQVTVVFATLILLWSVSGARRGFRLEGLDAHNEYRARHRAQRMNLTVDLNEEAQYCAEYYLKRRTIDHTCDIQYDNVGENLFLYFSTVKTSRRTIVRLGAKSWYDEIYDYDCATSVPTLSPQTLHFTQLVWKASSELGIGVARADGYTIFVALYYPAGNVYDQFGGVTNFKRNVQC